MAAKDQIQQKIGLIDANLHVYPDETKTVQAINNPVIFHLVFAYGEPKSSDSSYIMWEDVPSVTSSWIDSGILIPKANEIMNWAKERITCLTYMGTGGGPKHGMK